MNTSHDFLPQELLADIFTRYLNMVDRARCQCVSRRWKKLAISVQEQASHEEWQQDAVFYQVRYSQRLRARQELSETDRMELDKRLSRLLDEEFLDYNHLFTGLLTKVQSLLDHGATASYLAHDDNGLGKVVDIYLERPERCNHLFFDFFKELISSPCTAWRTNERYAGNGSLPVRWFIFKTCTHGGPWGYRSNGTPDFRWELFKLCRLMMYASQQQPQEQQQGTMLDIFYYIESECWTKHITFFLFEQLYQATSLLLSEEIVLGFLIEQQSWAPMLSREPFCLYSRRPVLNAIFKRLCLDGFVVCSIYKSLWSNKISKKNLHSLVRNQRLFRLGLIEHAMEDICRRKDRQLAEKLFRLEPRTMIAALPCAVSILEQTRGKTERLLNYWKAILATNDARHNVLRDLFVERMTCAILLDTEVLLDFTD